MANKNTGTDYEQLVQTIFSQIQNSDLIETINVQHDIIIQGKTLEHQIDVYWEFIVGGITYKTIVQAKDWNSAVKQEQLLTFAQVLADIPGQPRGIFVTKTGYQAGAKTFAKANGILLYELREPTDADWGDTMRNIKIELHAICPHYSNWHVVADGEWIEKNCDENFKIPDYYSPTETILENDNGESLSTLKEYIDRKIQEANSSFGEEIAIFEKFENPTFLASKNETFRFKVIEFGFNYYSSLIKQVIEISGDDIVGFVLKNVLEETQQRISPDKKVIDPKPYSLK